MTYQNIRIGFFFRMNCKTIQISVCLVPIFTEKKNTNDYQTRQDLTTFAFGFYELQFVSFSSERAEM